MTQFARSLAVLSLRAWVAPLNIAERLRRHQPGPASALNERSIEYGFALRCVSDFQPATVLDVGSGNGAWPALLQDCGCQVLATDKGAGYWGSAGTYNRHIALRSDDILSSGIRERFDMITCISVLEHIPTHDAAVAAMMERLLPGGHLVLTVPFNAESYVPNVYAINDTPGFVRPRFICQVFSEAELNGWMRQSSARLERAVYHEVFSGPFWSMGDRLPHPREADSRGLCHLATIALTRQHE